MEEIGEILSDTNFEAGPHGEWTPTPTSLALLVDIYCQGYHWCGGPTKSKKSQHQWAPICVKNLQRRWLLHPSHPNHLFQSHQSFTLVHSKTNNGVGLSSFLPWIQAPCLMNWCSAWLARLRSSTGGSPRFFDHAIINNSENSCNKQFE